MEDLLALCLEVFFIVAYVGRVVVLIIGAVKLAKTI
jgi:hypothetical protein